MPINGILNLDESSMFIQCVYPLCHPCHHHQFQNQKNRHHFLNTFRKLHEQLS
jgi:hypothetical protein